jgi:dolichol-phosphate mannosyltransferase
VVDDGSTDGTAERIAAAPAGLAAGGPAIRTLRLDRRCGKTAALRAGIAAARGEWIATMDGDGQNDPRDLPGMFALGRDARGPAPLVAGVRLRRHDGWSRLVATRLANGFRRRALGDECPDSGCGMKAFRRADFLELPGFEGMHRFLPALFQLYGHPLICRPVTHRPRLRGTSKYTNFGRAMVGIGDMLGVIWLRSRTRRPGRVTEL